MRQFPDTRWITRGGIWIGGSYAGGSIALVADSTLPENQDDLNADTNKRMTPLNRKTYSWARRLENSGLDVDVFRQARGPNDTNSVLETLRDYRYSIDKESFSDQRYFTKKVLNYSAKGKILIYMGAPLLNDFLYPLGYIPYRNWRQLRYEVLTALSAEHYDSRRLAMRDNLHRVREFGSIEGYIYLHDAHELPL